MPANAQQLLLAAQTAILLRKRAVTAHFLSNLMIRYIHYFGHFVEPYFGQK
jgi:hypothetical protein